MKRLAMALGTVLWSLVTSSSAQVPNVINYQGRLVDGTNLVNGTVGLSLRIYAKNGASYDLLYEDSNEVAVVDGLYATLIGDNTTFGNLATALAVPLEMYVEVAVNGTALSPRERLAAVAYAMKTTESDPLWTAQKTGYATGTPVYAEADPLWTAAKSGYATGTPLYVFAETDPLWAAASNGIQSALTNSVAKTGDTMTGALTINSGAGNKLLIGTLGTDIAIGSAANGDAVGIGIGNAANGNDGVAIGNNSRGYGKGAVLGRSANGATEGAAVGYAANGNQQGVAVGHSATGYSGVAVGFRSAGQNGVAIGQYTRGDNNGAAVGPSANAATYGAAVGPSANGYASGSSMGDNSSAYNHGVAVGDYSSGFDYGVAAGSAAIGDISGVAVGRDANGRANCIAVGAYANSGPGSYGVAVGYGARIDGSTVNGVAVGTGARVMAGAYNATAIGCVTNYTTESTMLRGNLFLDGGDQVYTNSAPGATDWGVKAFTIDHPLDPKNKVLRHYCMEGPQVWDIYAGNAQLKNGEAVVELPAYYSALNLEGSEIYSLTPVGDLAVVCVKEKVVGNRFVIKGDKDVEVSWTIKAQRNDPAAIEDLKQRPVEQLKSELKPGQAEAENAAVNTDTSAQ